MTPTESHDSLACVAPRDCFVAALLAMTLRLSEFLPNCRRGLVPESLHGSAGGGWWAIALIAFSFAFAAFSTLPLPWDDSHAMVNGVALSGGRLELLRFLREPHEHPVVAATTSFREMALALRGRASQVADLPPPQGNAESWLNGLRKQGVTHVALFRTEAGGGSIQSAVIASERRRKSGLRAECRRRERGDLPRSSPARTGHVRPGRGCGKR